MAYGKKKKGFWANTLEIAGLLLLVFLIRTVGFGLYQVPSGSMETTMLVGERFFADKFTYLWRDPRHREIIAMNEPPMFYPYSNNKLMNLWQHYVWGPSNWTKRVIGLPGDEIKGVIEDDQPVIYRNGVKLDELYLNKYPLIELSKESQEVIQALLRAEMRNYLMSGVSQERADQLVAQQEHRLQQAPRSYDPAASFQDQPFYRINPNFVVRNEKGKPELLWPGVARRSPYSHNRAKEGRNYWDGSDEFYVKLGPDEFWLMGDNRRGSQDARVFGPVKRAFIHGRIIFRLWSHDSDENWWIVDLIKHPIDFWKRMRWSRFFQRVS